MTSIERSMTVSESTHLGHPLAHALARRARVRALSIKGPVLAEQGLRAHRQSVDVDLWVSPDGLDDFMAEALVSGWTDATVVAPVPILPRHAVTLKHPLFAAELDVHFRYPGFLADAQEVFELAWQRRETVNIAHAEIPATSVEISAAIAAAHSIRSGAAGAEELRLLLDRLRAHPRSAELPAAVHDFARKAGADFTLLPFLQSLDGLPVRAAEPRQDSERRWRLAVIASDNHVSISAVAGLLAAPKRSWPRLLLRLMFLSGDEMRRTSALARRGPLGLQCARILRLARGVGHAPAAIRYVFTRSRN